MLMKNTTPKKWLAALNHLTVALAITLTAACTTPADHLAAAPQTTVHADDFIVVDCLLPPQVRQLGKMTYLTARRPIKIPTGECQIRGGEYVAFDRANFATALAIWMPMAESGDAAAQTYVGEIYQKGLGVAPRYDLAAQWYQKAALSGYRRAQINLGFLYEKGLGVPRDNQKASQWYHRATGLDTPIAFNQANLEPLERLELDRLRQENQDRSQRIAQLESTLSQTRTDLTDARNRLATRQTEISRHQIEMSRLKADLVRLEESDRTAASQQSQALRQALTDKEKELINQQQKAARLADTLAARQSEIDNYQNELSRLTDVIKNLPGPKIEINEPQITATRGITVAQVSNKTNSRRVSGRVWAPAGLSEFVINTRPVALDAKGFFSTAIRTATNTNLPVVVKAIDQNGRQQEVAFQFTLQPEPSPREKRTAELKSIEFGSYHALVIGNNDYRALPRLQTAVNDATIVSDVLKEKYGFKVTLLLNADRTRILSALNDYRKSLNNADNLLIYYAGHGELVVKSNQGYWLPVDAEPDNTVNWLPTYQVTEIMNLISAKHVIVIADTCYSGSLTRSTLTRLDAGKTDEEYQNWLKQLVKNQSRIVLSSGELKPVLDSGDGTHSVFAKSLIEILRANDEILRGIDLHSELAAKVVVLSERLGFIQVPQYAGLTSAGHEFGDFLFVPTGYLNPSG
jgi:hypothetical protein